MISYLVKLFLICSSVLFAIITSDIYVYLTDKPPEHRKKYLQKLIDSGVKYDQRDQVEFFGQYLTENKNGWPSITTAHRDNLLPDDHKGPFPLGAVSKSEILLCNESGYWQTYQSDRYGFPNPDVVWEQSGGDGSLMVVGDSFGVSTCLPRDKAYDHYIRQKFPNTKVVSARGANLEWYLAALREFGHVAKPETVIVLFFSNDVPGETFHFHPIFRPYLDPSYSQALIKRQAEIDALWKSVLRSEWEKAKKAKNNIEEVVVRDPFRMKDVILFRHLRNALGWSFERDSTNYKALQQLTAAMQKEVERWGGELIFVYLPSYVEILKRDQKMPNWLGPWFSDNKLNFIDISQAFFTDTPDQMFDFPGAHFNALGYRILGERINKLLQERKTITVKEAG